MKDLYRGTRVLQGSKMDSERIKKEIADGTFNPRAVLARLPKNSQTGKTAQVIKAPEEREVMIDVRLTINEETLTALNELCFHEGLLAERVIANNFEAGLWAGINEGRKKLGLGPTGPWVRFSAFAEAILKSTPPDEDPVKFRASLVDAVRSVSEKAKTENRAKFQRIVGQPVKPSAEEP